MTRCLQGLDVVVGAAASGYADQGHGFNMGPGGKNLPGGQPGEWQWENFWSGWNPYGHEVEIDELEQIRGELVGFDLASWQREGANTWNWENRFLSDRARVDVVGGFDIATWQRQMNQLKVIPLILAQVLVARGQQAIDAAIANAVVYDIAQAQIPFSAKMARASNREMVAGKLKWHADNIARLAPTAWSIHRAFQGGDKEAFKKAGAQIAAPYPNGNDLQKWVMEAFIEDNAVEEGATRVGQNWTAMWNEIGAAIAALPSDVAKKVKEAAWYLNWVYWAVIAGGVIALSLAGWGVGSGIKNRLSGMVSGK